jgi:hypothetical protein
MNRQEQRAARHREEPGRRGPEAGRAAQHVRESRWSRIGRYAAWTAVPFALLGFVLGDGLFLLTAALLVSGAVLLWSLRRGQRPGAGGSTSRWR